MIEAADRKCLYLTFSGVIDDQGTSKLCGALNGAANEKFDDVHLLLTTPGGYVGHGIFIYNHIRGLPLRVVMHNAGTVASIGTTLFMAAARRLCARNSIFMMHPVAMGAPGQVSTESLQATLESLIRDEARTESILRERTRLTEEHLLKRRVTDVYFSAEEALQVGLVDAIAEFALPPGQQIFHL